jgi:hypothetical protein
MSTLASEPQRRFVKGLIGRDPVSDLTNEDAKHIIGGYFNANREPHQHELEARDRALGISAPSGLCSCALCQR